MFVTRGGGGAVNFALAADGQTLVGCNETRVSSMSTTTRFSENVYLENCYKTHTRGDVCLSV